MLLILNLLAICLNPILPPINNVYQHSFQFLLLENKKFNIKE